MIRVLALLCVAGAAQAVELKPFDGTEDWTYMQRRARPGAAVESNEIRFSANFKKKNGSTYLFWAQAITNKGEVVWKPLKNIPAASCVQDFVGRSDLNLPYVCTDGLKVGDQWQSSADDASATEEIQFVVTGEESVTTSAGTFNALKIEGKGKRTSPAETLTVTYWFAPEVKAMARSIREYRTLRGAPIITITDELIAVKLNP